MVWLRSLIAIALALLVTVTSQEMAILRGQTGAVGTTEDVGVETAAGTTRRHFLPVLVFTQRSVMPFDTTVRPTFTHFEPGDEANETEPVPMIAKRRRTKTEMSFTFMLTKP